MPAHFNTMEDEQALTGAGVTREQAAVHARTLAQVLGEVALCKDLNRVEVSLPRPRGFA